MNPRVTSLADAVAKLPDGKRSTFIVDDPNLALKRVQPERTSEPGERGAWTLFSRELYIAAERRQIVRPAP